MDKFLKIGLLLICVLFISACSEEEGLESLDGEWKLLSTSGGTSVQGLQFEGDVTMTIDDGNLNMLLDESLIIEANLVSEKEEYNGVVIITISCRKPLSPFIFASDQRLSVDKDGNKLTLSELCDDCFNYHFVQD